MLANFFKLQENQTTFRTEILAGLTTFLTMAYIIFVQPAVLSTDFYGNPTGLNFNAVLLATCIASAAASIFMGLYAQYPIALAPGMGENFFFVSVILALSSLGFQNAWQVALGIVFYSGILFLLLSIFKVRAAIIDAVSPSMRNGIAVGIGLFIAFIGLRNGGIVIGKTGTLLGINTQILSPDVAVFFFGLLLTAVLRVRRIRGAILFGILGSAILALFLGQIKLPPSLFGLPSFSQSAFLKMDLFNALNWSCLPFIIIFTFMAVFDTVGTLIGVAEQAGFIKNNHLPRADKVLVVDSAASVLGAGLGTSTVTAYIESVTGVEYGGRTGLTSITAGLLFILALFFCPLVGMIANYPPITAPALIIVGAMMIQNVSKIKWTDYDECIPAFLTMIGIPMMYSIADGLAFGLITYPLIKFLSGKGKDVRWLMYVLALVLLLYFILFRSKLH
ncbi:MAG: NCS2 family permease [Candidatus Omnitrophica bacterium]|nr:NCS2 family permease [Candidatus Omnitrophota bacterium]MDD5671406.1 NCS2 family permease [Candidatus Omnitrophota bacterium]